MDRKALEILSTLTAEELREVRNAVSARLKAQEAEREAGKILGRYIPRLKSAEAKIAEAFAVMG